MLFQNLTFSFILCCFFGIPYCTKIDVGLNLVWYLLQDIWSTIKFGRKSAKFILIKYVRILIGSNRHRTRKSSKFVLIKYVRILVGSNRHRTDCLTASSSIAFTLPKETIRDTPIYLRINICCFFHAISFSLFKEEERGREEQKIAKIWRAPDLIPL